jgi:hypothetical protein
MVLVGVEVAAEFLEDLVLSPLQLFVPEIIASFDERASSKPPAVQLPPGPKLLRFRVSAKMGPGIVHPPNPDPFGGFADAIITMPPAKSLRLGVRSAEVGLLHGVGGFLAFAATAGASTLAVSPGGRPDLFWTVEYGGRGVYSSPVRYKSRSATWTNYTDWLLVAAGDRIRVHVLDRRVASGLARFYSAFTSGALVLYPQPVRSYGTDELGVFDFSVDALANTSFDIGPLKNGSFAKFYLGPTRLRE